MVLLADLCGPVRSQERLFPEIPPNLSAPFPFAGSVLTSLPI
jgi:hypothetical protein